MPNLPSDMLFARVQLRAPHARSLVISGAREDPACERIGLELAASIRRGGYRVRWLDLIGTMQLETLAEGVEILPLPESGLGDAQRVRDALAPADAFTVVRGAGIIEHAATLRCAAEADGVILVARTGHTERSDLATARAEVERAAGTLLGAVLVA